MKKLFILFFPLALLVAACGKKAVERTADVVRADIAATEKRIDILKDSLRTLKSELVTLDPASKAEFERTIPVTTIAIKPTTFKRFIEVTGSIESKQSVNISTEMPAQIVRVLVDAGDEVKAGQLLVELDGSQLRRSLAELETQYQLAKTIFEKQEGLWKEKIGTEVQYLQAKTQKEALEKSMATLKVQIGKTLIKAAESGLVDDVYAKVGEYAAPGMPLVGLVGLKEPYVQANLSESYLGKIKKGDTVSVFFPTIQASEVGKVKHAGASINPGDRTFTIEVAIKKNIDKLKPKMLGIIKLNDFTAENAIVVPSMYIQRDKIGDFVFVTQTVDGRTRAKRVNVKRGKTNADQTQIIDGLNGTENLIAEGFRDVTEGVALTLVAEPMASIEKK